jgi:hypothetical protein
VIFEPEVESVFPNRNAQHNMEKPAKIVLLGEGAVVETSTRCEWGHLSSNDDAQVEWEKRPFCSGTPTTPTVIGKSQQCKLPSCRSDLSLTKKG